MFNGHLNFPCELSVHILCPFFLLKVSFLLIVSILPVTKLPFSYVHFALQFFYYNFPCNLSGHTFYFQVFYF